MINRIIKVLTTTIFGIAGVCFIVSHAIHAKQIGCLERNQVLSNWECVPKSVDFGAELQ